MSKIQIIDSALLAQVSAQAETSPRRRKNYNFHASETDISSRLLNAVEMDSYIPPHRHNDITKDETLVIVRGRVGVVFFDNNGAVTGKATLEPAGEAVGVNIPHGVFHALVALAPGSIFFEAKAGPYRTLAPEETAPWAPREGEPQATAYLEEMKHLFS